MTKPKDTKKTKAMDFLKEHPEVRSELQLSIEDFTQRAKAIVAGKGFSADVIISFSFFKE